MDPELTAREHQKWAVRGREGRGRVFLGATREVCILVSELSMVGYQGWTSQGVWLCLLGQTFFCAH